MPSKTQRLNAHIYSFNRGEVSAAALARTDLEPLRLAAEVQENLMPYVLGKGLARSGSKYIATTPSSNQARLLPFVFSVSDEALLELSNVLLRVYVSDALITRAAVTSTVTNGTFAATEGWLTTGNSGGGITIGGILAGHMTLYAPNVGSRAELTRPVTTTSTGTEHAFRIIITQGSLTFRCGTTAGDQTYIKETALGVGEHSLAFTPTDGTFSPWFQSKNETYSHLDSITIESAGVMTLPTPWLTADLRNVRFDQSGDIIYCANEDYQQRKIERRGTRSWSVVKYSPSTVPFTLSRTATVRLTPGATRGNTTLTADRDFFRSTHVGALFKLTHNGQFVRQSFSTDGGTNGAGTFGDVIKMPAWASGTTKPTFRFLSTDSVAATGTRIMQVSFEGEDTGFREYNSDTTRTAVQTVSVDDTVETWWRRGIPNGGQSGGTWVLCMSTDHGGGSGICRVTSITSSTVANVEVLKPFVGVPTDGGGTEDWVEGEWSDIRGWPSGACFFDGRLWWGGRDKIWGSVSDDYENFDVDVEGDSGPILRNIATGAVNQVRWCMPLSRLIVGTEGSEVAAKASSLDEPLTPTEFTLKDVSTQGSAAVSPVKADTNGYFVQRSGKRVYAMQIKDFDYQSSDLTRINDEIGGTGIVEMTIQRQPDTRIWCARDDGDVAILIHEPDEDVTGWVRFLTGSTNQNATATEGSIESVCALPGDIEDTVYLAIKRIVNGSTVRYVEKMALETEAVGTPGSHYMADSYATLAGPASSMSGMTHLNSEQVIAWGTSVTGGTTGPLGTFTVTDGGFAIGKSCTNVVAGLKYNWRYKSAKLAYGAQAGTALMQPKKVSSVGLLLENFLIDSVQYGRDFSTMYPLPRTIDGAVPGTNTLQTVHDERAFPFAGNWDTDSRVCLKGSAPYPFTALGLVVGVELEEKV